MCQEVDAKQWERLSFQNDSCCRQLNRTVAVNNRYNRFFVRNPPKKETETTDVVLEITETQKRKMFNLLLRETH